MNFNSIIISLLAVACFFFFSPGAISEANSAGETDLKTAQPCENRVTLEIRSYWYYELYFGIEEIKDEQGQRTGRVRNGNHSCFSVALKDLKDPMERTHGYKDALQEILRYRSIYIQLGNDDPKARFGRAQKFVGQNFETQKDMQKWWYENKDYVLWSAKSNQLIVDEKSKSDQNPVSKEYGSVLAHEYWYSRLMNRIRNETRKGETLKADMWTYHGYRGITLPLNDLKEPGAKEMGYLYAVSEVIQSYLSSNTLSEDQTNIYIERLQSWTGQPYTRPEKWNRWWKKYHDHLKYSIIEDRLIPFE